MGYPDRLHWACEKCIVRSMCKDDSCFMTELFHPYCIICKKNKKCKNKCKLVLRSELFDKIGSYYKGIYTEALIKHINEYSLFYQLSKYDLSKKCEFRWPT